MNYFFNILFLFCCLFPLHGFGTVDNLKDKIHGIIQKHHKDYSFHGNVVIKQGERIIYQNSFGLAHDSFKVPNTMRSRFMIASLSKQFTAALIMVLAQEGVIDIHSPYSRYVPTPERMLPKNQKRWNEVTIYELLTHTSGLYKDVRRTDIYNPENYQPFVSIILDEQLENYDIFRFTGNEPMYSNFGYMLLAYLAEEVSGQYYEDLLKEKIFKPLGMVSSGEYHRMKNISFMAEGHVYPDGTDKLGRRCCHDGTSFKGSHSLYSDAGDLIVWLDNLNSENPKVLTKKSIELMTRVHVHGDFMTYGLGFHVDQVNGSKRYWHDGFEYGYLSLVSVIPGKALKIIVLGNRHHMDDIAYGNSYTTKMNDEIAQLF